MNMRLVVGHGASHVDVLREVSMKIIYLFLLCIFSQSAFADLVIKEKTTIKSNTKEISHSTLYFADSMFRMDMITKDIKYISIIKNQTVINCQKRRDSDDKGQCTIGNMGQANALLGLAEINIREYDVTRLNQTGKFAGRNCRFFRTKMAMDIKLLGLTTSSKSDEKLCVDHSLKVPVEFIAYQIMSTLRGSMPKKQFDDITAKAKIMDGLVIYSKVTGHAKTQVDLVQSAAKIFGGDSRSNDKSVVVREVLSVKKTRIPKSQFQIPKGEYDVQDLTKENAK
jgi:hypothetical protein